MTPVIVSSVYATLLLIRMNTRRITESIMVSVANWISIGLTISARFSDGGRAFTTTPSTNSRRL